MVPHPGDVPVRGLPHVRIIGAAVVTAAISLLIIKRLGLRSADGQPLGLEPKTVGSGVRYLAGGTMFGLGWALTEPARVRSSR